MKILSASFVLHFMFLSFLYAGNDLNTDAEKKDAVESGTVRKVSMDWYVRDHGKDISGVEVRVFSDETLLLSKESEEIMFDLELPINHIYRIEISKKGYLKKSIKIALYINPVYQDLQATEMFVDLLSEQEFLRTKQHQKEEILMYNPLREVFEPWQVYAPVMEDRFNHLSSRASRVRKKRRAAPTQKIKS